MTDSIDPRDCPTPAKRKGLLRAWFALRYSLNGIRATLRTESAFRQETAAAGVLIPAAMLLPLPTVERVVLVLSVLLVLIVELLNSAIEAVVDRISLDRHELSRRAKDCGSAAVFVALLACVTAWALLCAPLFLRWLHALTAPD